MLGIGSALEFGTTIINKIFPDKEAANAAKLRLLELQQSGELKELEAQAQIVDRKSVV